MKLTYPSIKEIFDTRNCLVNTIVIENQLLYTEICQDLFDQTQGLEGKVVVSENEKPIDISKNVELLTQFIPFSLNKKGIITKLVGKMEKIASEPELFEDTMTLLSSIEKYLMNIAENFEGDISFGTILVGNIIKSAGVEFNEEYDSLCEKIIDYMELVREYDREKLFIFVNVRSYISDKDCFEMFDTILRKQLHVILIENCEHMLLDNEKRVIIDNENCEIK